MRKVLVGGALLILISGAALLTPTIRDLISTKQTPAKVVVSKTQTKVTKPRDPKTHDFSDVDYAQKKLIHHQLGAMIADKAKTDATKPEIRQLAEQVSSRETERASIYAALLTSWNESYLNITDFPETGGCNGYPTFSGMLPHLDIGKFRLSNGESVDTTFLTLLIEHHKKATDLVKLEGAKIGFGELVKLREASQKEYKAEISTLEALQKSIL
ncbi:DUF305 domain-containing protein [Candidatus Saccharibacteria bacterium]|nr:DUF305 domain-containing protein [Candidatus Saccharibacteria bacterium]